MMMMMMMMVMIVAHGDRAPRGRSCAPSCSPKKKKEPATPQFEASESPSPDGERSTKRKKLAGYQAFMDAVADVDEANLLDDVYANFNAEGDMLSSLKEVST